MLPCAMLLQLSLFVSLLSIQVHCSSSDQLPVSLYYDDTSSNPCNLASIELVDQNEIIKMSEVSGRVFSTQTAFASNRNEQGCIYQETRNNASRIVAFSIQDGLISGLIAFNDASYQTNKAPISKASGERIQLQENVNLTDHLGGACGVNTADNQQKWTTSSIKLNYVNASITNYYMELYLVVDYAFYSKHSGKYMNYIMEMVNYVNAVYRGQGIHIVVVGMEVWSDYNRIVLSSNANTNLQNLVNYQIQMSTHHDVLHMINGISYGGVTIGIAYLNSLCEFGYSVGMSTDYSSSSSLYTAMIMAHELGHNLGLDHDTKDCSCSPDDTCVMNTYASKNVRLMRWSDCSLWQMHANLQSGAAAYCMKNNPENGFDWSKSDETCGNGIVDAGEDCDVGVSSTDNNCCNMNSCTFVSGAECASGGCCNKLTCQMLSANVQCRSAADECDKVEYCNGRSEECPADSYYDDKTYCDNNRGTCYKGICGSHDKQCKWLFGETSYKATDSCYQKNLYGGKFALGYCTYTHVGSQSYIVEACTFENYPCGTLHCQGGYAKKWTNSPTSYYNATDSSGEICFHLVRDSKLSGLRDPGMVPNGAICGTNKICVDSKCIGIVAESAVVGTTEKSSANHSSSFDLSVCLIWLANCVCMSWHWLAN